MSLIYVYIALSAISVASAVLGERFLGKARWHPAATIGLIALAAVLTLASEIVTMSEANEDRRRAAVIEERTQTILSREERIQEALTSAASTLKITASMVGADLSTAKNAAITSQTNLETTRVVSRQTYKMLDELRRTSQMAESTASMTQSNVRLTNIIQNRTKTALVESERTLFPFNDLSYAYALRLNLSSKALGAWGKELRKAARADFAHPRRERQAYFATSYGNGGYIVPDIYNDFRGSPTYRVPLDSPLFSDAKVRQMVLNPGIGITIFRAARTIHDLLANRPRPDFVATVGWRDPEGVTNLVREDYPSGSEAFSLAYHPETGQCEAEFYESTHVKPDAANSATQVFPLRILGLSDLAGSQLVLRFSQPVPDQSAVDIARITIAAGPYELLLHRADLKLIGVADGARVYTFSFPTNFSSVLSLFAQRRRF